MAHYLSTDRGRRTAGTRAIAAPHPAISGTALSSGQRRTTTDLHRNNGRYSLTKSSNGGGSHLGELLEHLALAMTMHVRNLRQDALRVPPSVDELAAVLVHYVQTRQVATLAEHEWTAMSRAAHDDKMTGRLLVSKAEAAELLGVSVRTVERLIAHGQLPLLHIERASRLRLADIEAYVNSLAGEQTATPTHGGQES
ncbi:helix-turn-helix transcriptional regulator [Pseudonocardia charpentierae]|uniref:Helix-turn-helix domain-containing protein n=1 Tax=Pseudonocardia charpentierae TaxID=3075545 RepID=A0ABU2NCK8_9PSEU|nr:helix-turn-helix domain-containing protein [Pseudonocardia sp. DSM 45834]MDT0351697.1 helix-turn-helix domain-containing protein [Pseudonocardia sp. DSM 45834]